MPTENFKPEPDDDPNPERSLVAETHSDACGQRQVKARCSRCDDLVSEETREKCGGCQGAGP